VALSDATVSAGVPSGANRPNSEPGWPRGNPLGEGGDVRQQARAPRRAQRQGRQPSAAHVVDLQRRQVGGQQLEVARERILKLLRTAGVGCARGPAQLPAHLLQGQVAGGRHAGGRPAQRLLAAREPRHVREAARRERRRADQ
jgi:hypothetical protein